VCACARRYCTFGIPLVAGLIALFRELFKVGSSRDRAQRGAAGGRGMVARCAHIVRSSVIAFAGAVLPGGESCNVDRFKGDFLSVAKHASETQRGARL